MSSSTVYLITGANRPNGIGFGLTAHILATHENAFVYAGARDPEKSTALKELSVKYPGRISVVKCISGDTAVNAAVAKEIEERHGHVDTVIANAGLAGLFRQVHEIPVSEMEEHFHVNVMGPVVLFQSVYAPLKKSTNPRFISVSSIGGSLTTGIITTQMGGVCYGSSKAALNWVTRKIHFENDWLVAFPLHPGSVVTDMSESTLHAKSETAWAPANNPNTVVEDFSSGDKTGVFNAFLTGDEPTSAKAAVSILKIINESTREKDGGEFLNAEGTKIPW